MRPSPASLPTLLFVAALAPCAASCGSRSDLLDADSLETGGAGGTGGTGGTTSSTTSSGTTSSTTTTIVTDACTALVVQPTFVVPPTSGVVTKPRTALLVPSGDVVLSALVTSPGGGGGQLVAGRLDAFSTWPPSFTEVTQIDVGVTDYDVGPGPNGPVALVQHPGTGAILFQDFYSKPAWFEAPINEGDEILFVMGIDDRYFYAQSNAGAGYEVLAVGSYEPNSLPQSEQPLICVKGALLGAAIRVSEGFLAVFTAPGLPGNQCDSQAPKPGSFLSFESYHAPPGNGTFLQLSQGAVVVSDPVDPFVHLGLAATSFGAWLVFQGAGSSAEMPPPIYAAQFDITGHSIEPVALHDVSPGGYIPPEVAVASLGDTLAVAWVEAIDPSAPTIQLQLLRPDGSKGAAATIQTYEAWLSGELRLLPSPDQKSLLVSWAGLPEDGVAAVTRVDCVGAL